MTEHRGLDSVSIMKGSGIVICKLDTTQKITYGGRCYRYAIAMPNGMVRVSRYMRRGFVGEIYGWRFQYANPADGLVIARGKFGTKTGKIMV